MSNPNILEVMEGIQYQTSDEQIAYSITTTNWASTPAAPSAAAYDEYDNSVVTSTVFPVNNPSAVGDVITLSLLRALTQKHTYRIEVRFTSGGNTYECYFRVNCPI